MNITRMSVDDIETNMPSWDMVEAAVQSLDGENTSNVFLSSSTEFPWLSISGGKDGYVTVQFGSGPAQLFTLRSPNTLSGNKSMVLAGQRASLDSSEFVTKHLALQAAKGAWAEGSISDDLLWEPA